MHRFVLTLGLVAALLVAPALSATSTALAAGHSARRDGARIAAPVEETVLLMGQSNMVGRDQIVRQEPDNRVRAFLSDTWQPAVEPLHGVGYGPGVSFGFHLVEHTRVRVARLIPCAQGSNRIERWMPTGDLYRACLEELSLSGRAATGALLYQGESDAGTLEDANAWDERFGEVVAGLRRDTGNATLPIVFAHLGTTNRPAPYWKEVKASQASVSLPGVAMIRTEDLPTFDGLHLTADAQRIVGCRFAREFAGLRGLSVSGEAC